MFIHFSRKFSQGLGKKKQSLVLSLPLVYERHLDALTFRLFDSIGRACDVAYKVANIRHDVKHKLYKDGHDTFLKGVVI